MGNEAIPTPLAPYIPKGEYHMFLNLTVGRWIRIGCTLCIVVAIYAYITDNHWLLYGNFAVMVELFLFIIWYYHKKSTKD